MAASSSVLERYPAYEAVIGLEVHVQLTTRTKIFCGCANERSAQPNIHVCPICLGHPGVLPVLNKRVVDFAIQLGLAVHGNIASTCEFARKHYFYPDLPKGYQITQHEYPIITDGYLEIQDAQGVSKKVRLIRIHMEEDAGKNIHVADSDESFVDLNRAGVPLLEIVSHPDMASSEEVRSYLKTVRSIVMYLGICSGNMEEGAFRADTNISVRKKGDPRLGTRCELKNINSFKFIADATEYEIERQIQLLEGGKKVVQETRLWDTKEHRTVSMRSKEEAADYRYFADPDLPLVQVDEAWIAQMRSGLPELPSQKFARLQKEYGLSAYEAEILINDLDLARYFEEAARLSTSKQLINWILRDVMAAVKEKQLAYAACQVTPQKLAALVDLIDAGTINNRTAKELFDEIVERGGDPEKLVKERGLEQVGSVSELEQIVKEVVAAHAQQVAQYQAGNERLFGFFVGQVMQKTKGKGNPRIIQELLKKHLA